jgi:exodeoxyribonuclease VII large subunit
LSGPITSPTPPPTLTVTQLNRQAKSLLEGHFDFVWVSGEISNFAAPSSGHWYFTLKDGSAQVRCAMFRNRNQRVRFEAANGDAIRLRCRVSLYEGRGEFQLIVEHMEAAGAGALQAAFEALKTKLHSEGLFDSDRKHALPSHVSHIGIVTSPTGAAIHDMLTVLKRRCPTIAVSLLPVAVQGGAAAGQISAAIERANRWHIEGKVKLDVLIIGRGGGSLEDLWAFNEEVVARAIAASDLPIVSAVGHEVDFSIADLVADHRAPTPSAAAELLSPDQREWEQQLAGFSKLLQQRIQTKLETGATALNHLHKRLKHPGSLLREQSQRLDGIEQRLIFAQQTANRTRRSQLEMAKSRLRASSPSQRLSSHIAANERIAARLNTLVLGKLESSRTRLSHMGALLDSLSPLRTVERGYAIVSDPTGRVITRAASVSKGDIVHAKLAAGELKLSVIDVSTEAEV